MKTVYKLMSISMFLFGLAVYPVFATIITFDATLTGSGEVPPNGSPATGTFSLTLDDVADTLMINETFSGLSAPATAAHIHAGAGPGANAPVVLNFVGSGFPTGATSGSFNHTFDLETSLSGSITINQFISDLESGLAYANIHDADFPGGEIRGQLEAVLSAMPEPETSFLLMLGFGVLIVIRRMMGRAL
jgi:hypothetical protein